MFAARVPTLLVLVAPLVVPPPAPAQQFTLEGIMSTPFPDHLVAAPNQGKVAWVRNAEGVRNIWVAEAPEYRGRQLTAYAEDDGQELTDLQFGPGGNHIVYVRGGAPNRDREIPNPLSEPEQAERAVWIIAAAGGEPRRLAEGASPAISPDGQRVAFIRGGQVWSVPAVAQGEPEQMFHIRGRAGSLRWSPDGSTLSFVSNRGDHAFVGLYDVQNDAISYPAPSVGRDGSPVWSPDGRRLAFLRIPNERDDLPFFAQRTALPWSIHVVDLTSGDERMVWKADGGTGSAFQGVVADNQLLWGDGDHIVFPWEKRGWTHLYSLRLRDGRVSQLTSGQFEVEHVTISPDRHEVVFSSNQGDIDRRHLWRVPVGGGTARPVTTGTGIEWAPALTPDGAVAFLASGAREPAHAAVIAGSSERRALVDDWLPDDFPLDDLVEPQQVIFSAADGMRIHGQLFVPRNTREGERRPAAIFFHGGSRRQMLLGWHYRGYYHNAYAMNQYLASRGFVVLAVNYRSGIGYGMEFREAENYGAGGASEFNDVMGAGLYLRSRSDVDPDRIGLWGGSYGGYLTALGLARASDLFAAGVDLHGVHDWNPVIKNFVPSYEAAARPEIQQLAFESSPMHFLDGWRSPVLLIHGDDDRNVPFSESVDLAEELARRGVEFEQLIFPDEVHGFLLHRNWLAAYRAAAAFLKRKLQPSTRTTGQ